MKHFIIPLFVAASFVFLLQLSPSEAGEWPEDCGNNKTHNFTFGAFNRNDRLLYSLHEQKSYSFLRKMSYDYNIPPLKTYPTGIIDYIEVLDQYKDGNGGCVYWKTGGLGTSSFVTLHIKSQRNHGVDFIINVYGH